MSTIDDALAAEEAVESITQFKVTNPKWSVEVFRLSDQAPDVFHVDVQTSDVFRAEDMPAFADAVTGALAHLQKAGGLRV